MKETEKLLYFYSWKATLLFPQNVTYTAKHSFMHVLTDILNFPALILSIQSTLFIFPLGIVYHDKQDNALIIIFSNEKWQ
jgi:hypothetical protein